jgi:5-methylcytosine-specific restriction enzyme subunit McrC
MRRLTLTEYEKSERVPLSREERHILADIAPSLAVVPSEVAEGCYDLTPASWVGAISLGTLAIEIRPKLPIKSVLFMISYALDPRQWMRSEFDFGEERSLLEAIIPGFAAQVHRALHRGLLRGYRSEETALPTVRGRLRFDDQIRDRYGIFPPAWRGWAAW